MPAGLGVYLPESERAFYINVGHLIADERFPRAEPEQLAAAVQPFLDNPRNVAIMHNATYDLRVFFKLGIGVRCRVACTLILTHRADENLRSHGKEPTFHYHLDQVTYGLKELMVVYFNRRPPRLRDVVGDKNPISAPVESVAQYCVLDVVNSFCLYERAMADIRRDPDLLRLVQEIDNPNNVPLARMMAAGILVDEDEARSQKAAYEAAIQRCREEIWRTLQVRWGLDTPNEIRRVLHHCRLPDISDSDWKDEEATHEAMLDLFRDCAGEPHKRKVIALLIAKGQMQQRISAFLEPQPERVRYSASRLYPDRFASTLVTTRFASSPNLQNLPKRADKVDEEDEWRAELPPDCAENFKTRNIFIPRPGCKFVSLDLSAAEPRYLAMLFQRALERRERDYWTRRDTLARERREKYSDLLRAMYALRPEAPDIPHEAMPWPDYEEDPLWQVFKYGEPFDDPYNALLAAMDGEGYERARRGGRAAQWFDEWRWRGKKAFLALAYGSQAASLAPQLGWSVEQTENAIRKLESQYATLNPLRELTLREMLQLGEVRSLWGRPRRLNGYYQMVRPGPVTVQFYRMRPVPRTYVARVIPLGWYKQGIQAFVEECYVELDDGERGEVVLAGNPDGTVRHISRGDPFANADHFNQPPFRNLNFSQINWVRDEYGLRRHLAEQARASRQAFNALCQATGADHLRWLMNSVDQEVCRRAEFRDCLLVLTMHDSLLYEVPQDKAAAFAAAAGAVVSRRPLWASIDMKADIEIGDRFGEMKKERPV